ncbi:MAG TPA: response regulator transcription factor [Acidobacteriaceae bacterium]
MSKQAPAKPQTKVEPPLRDARLRVGVIAADPLRLLGFQALFDGHIVVHIVPIAANEPLQEPNADILLIAAQNTDQIFGLIRSIRRARSTAPMIVMATSEEPEFIERVLRVGAQGYLTTAAALGEIEDALASVYEGGQWTPSKAQHTAIGETPAPDSMARPEAFTTRERQVMMLLMAGQSNREIALALRIEERTVKSHVARLLKKMGVRNRTALTMQVIARGLVGRRLDS